MMMLLYLLVVWVNAKTSPVTVFFEDLKVIGLSGPSFLALDPNPITELTHLKNNWPFPPAWHNHFRALSFYLQNVEVIYSHYFGQDIFVQCKSVCDMHPSADLSWIPDISGVLVRVGDELMHVDGPSTRHSAASPFRIPVVFKHATVSKTPGAMLDWGRFINETFLVDTGSDTTWLHFNDIRRALVPSLMRFICDKFGRMAVPVRLPIARVGSVTRTIEAYAMLPIRDTGFERILGLDVLAQFQSVSFVCGDVTVSVDDLQLPDGIDLQSNEVSFVYEKGFLLPKLENGRRQRFEAAVSAHGNQGQAMLDTGSESSSLPPFGNLSLGRSTTQHTETGLSSALVYNATFKILGAKFFTDMAMFTSHGGYDLLLGSDILSQLEFHLVMSGTRGRIHIFNSCV
jgi:hypothetical protein